MTITKGMRKGFKESLTSTGNTQRKYKFSNGYGASVINGAHTYGGPQGLWELAVLGADGHLDFDTPVTDDVLGWLTESEVNTALDEIKELPAVQS